MNRLAVLWSAQPTSSCFAPLAEALRKRGALEQATAVAVAGVTSRPHYLPGRLVMARIYRDQGQWQAAEAELRMAIALDASHPVVREALDEVRAHLAPAEIGADSVGEEFSEAATADDDAASLRPDDSDETGALPMTEPVLTESLAMLYRGQGHLEQAVAVLDALVARTPENAALAARRDAVRAEFEASRPRPYAAARSGGRPVRDWLSSLANSRAAAPPSSSFDAFYQAPVLPPSEAGDLAAFQAWLRELDR